MRSAATKPEEPAPERADLDAKAARVLDGQAELIARATALLETCPDPRLIRQLVTEVVGWSLHTEEMRAELARYTAANAGNGHILAALLEREQKLQASPAQPAEAGPRHSRARSSRWRDIPGQRALFSVKVVAFIALLGSGLRSLVRAHRIAAALTAVTLPVAVGAGTYIALPHASAPGGAGASAGASVPGWHTSASPIPSSSLIALTRPKPKHAARGKHLDGSGLPLLCCSPAPAPSSSSAAPSASASASVSVAAGNAALAQLTFTTLDLSNPADPSVQFTLTATGSSGWVSWKITTDGTDLDFSGTHGVLNAGGSVVVTVSLASVLDTLTEQTFTVNNTQSVTVSLPLPVPLPSVSVPAPVTSLLPSSAASLLG